MLILTKKVSGFNMTTKRAALYIRVSTPEQKKHGYSMEAQEEKLRAFSTAKDFHVSKVYADGGFSGAKLERPALLDMIQDIEDNKIDVVLVYKLDRLSRSQKNTMHLIEDVFLKNKVDFISMQESFDTTTSFGRAMIGILSVFAQLERDNITERMAMGKLERVKRGFYMGGGAFPFGYKYDEYTGELNIVEEEAIIVRRMFELFLSGSTINSIVNQLSAEFPSYSKTFMDSTVRRRLSSEYYVGRQKYQGKVYNAKHEAIISQSDYDEVQKMLAARPHSNAFQHTYLFSGIAICKKCGHAYNGYESSHKVKNKVYKYQYYRCSAQTWKFKKKNGWCCSAKSIRCETFDQKIIEEIRNRASSKQYTKVVKNSNGSIIKEIEKAKAQQEKLVDLYLNDRIPTEVLDKKTEDLNQLIIQLKSKLQKADTKRDSRSFDKSLKELLEGYETLTFEEKRKLIEKVVDRIEVDGDNIEVYFFM